VERSAFVDQIADTAHMVVELESIVLSNFRRNFLFPRQKETALRRSVAEGQPITTDTLRVYKDLYLHHSSEVLQPITFLLDMALISQDLHGLVTIRGIQLDRALLPNFALSRTNNAAANMTENE
jgi:hypothetical protein